MPLLTAEELAELNTLDGIGGTIERSPGELFFKEGEPGDYALLIKNGHVKAVQGTPPRIIDLRGPGDIVGEMGVLRSQQRMASIIAFNHVEALYLPGPIWKKFLYEHPRAMHALLVMTADMADRATMKKVESELAVAQQLARRLMDLAGQGLAEPDGEGALVLRLHQQDLADLIGAKKLQSVKKVLGQLNKKEIIRTARQEIKIVQPAVLRQIADGDLTV